MKYWQSYNEILESSKAKIDNHSHLSIVFYSFITLFIVSIISFGLRTIESTIYNPDQMLDLLRVKTVLAAENTNQATLYSQSHTNVNIKPKESFTFTLKYKNSGTSTWTKESVFLKSLTTAIKFRHEYWPDPFLPAQLQEESVAPGEIGTFVFALQAPTNFNEYSGDFLLVKDNVLIKGGETQVGMNVVVDPSKIVSQPKKIAKENDSNGPKPQICTLNLKIASANGINTNNLDNYSCVSTFDLPPEGPLIKAGLFYTDEAIKIKNDKAFQVYDEDDKLLASIKANTLISFNYIDSKKEYAFDYNNRTIRSKKYLKLVNFNDGIFTITSYKDVPTWNTSINYNQFTGDLEIKYNDYRDRVWVVEQLPMEDYLKGIKEASNPDPIEYLKTMTVAARTYALYHVNRYHGTDAFFDVYTDEKDQVYKGYVVSQTMPNLVKAVEETSGVIASYNNEIIVAYYSARSGGSTIDYNNIPYLKSKPTPYSASLAKWGHGIGIDAYDAKARAEEENLTYAELLKYYYTGINIEKIY